MKTIKSKSSAVIYKSKNYHDEIKSLLAEAVKNRAKLIGADLSGADLAGAKLIGAKLIGADLSEANLSGADLIGANLRRAIGNGRQIKSFQIEKYFIVFTSDILAISCQQHPIEKWKNFTSSEIATMDKDALSWWTKWKDFIFQAIELSKGE